MLLSSRSPITRLLTVLCYAAAAGAGQGLHLLAGHDHGHLTAEQAGDAGHWHVSHTSTSPLAAAVDAGATDEHDADECPICQYHSLGQWYRPSEGVATSTTVAEFTGSQVQLFRQRLPVRPLGPRGPPSFSATLA